MKLEAERTFDSIESAQEFIALLSQAVQESKRDLEAHLEKESGSSVPRRLDALQATLYSVEKLEFHISRSRRILNDLRSLRRLLFEERMPVTVPQETSETPKAKAAAQLLPVSPQPGPSRPRPWYVRPS
jgi:predicted nuclease of restriction endonuclease-like RecB superfamily